MYKEDLVLMGGMWKIKYQSKARNIKTARFLSKS